MKCPCGSKKTFDNCCFKVITTKKAVTAEQLMRSRYSAYATNNAQYIFDTYASSSKKEQSLKAISQWAKQCKWISLSIKSTTTHGDDATVEFIAHYVQNSTLYQLHENSNFIKTDEHWYYVDGEILNHKLLNKIKVNELCPCGTGKKFKKCCGTRYC